MVAGLGERAWERQDRKFVVADLDERRLDRQERMLERTEDWAGELEYEQRVRLREAADRMCLTPISRLRYQSAHESKAVSMLQTSATLAGVQTFLAAVERRITPWALPVVLYNGAIGCWREDAA